MAITVWPVDAVGGEPEYNGRELRQAQTALMFGATAARPLGAMSGVRIGTPASTVALSGFNWTVKPHSGVLDLQVAAEASAYQYAVGADETGTIDAAHATYPRVDILTVRLDDPSESDGSTNPGVTVNYVAGTAASSPVAPATPARSMVLANLSVPASGGGNPSASWIAPRAVAAGGIATARNNSELTAIPAYAGMMAYRADNATTYQHDGTTWREYHSDTGWVAYSRPASGISVGNGSLICRYRDRSGVVTFAVRLIAGSTTNITGTLELPLPVAASDPTMVTASGVRLAPNGVVGARAASSTTLYLYDASTGAVWGSGTNFDAGDEVRISGTYQRA